MGTIGVVILALILYHIGGYLLDIVVLVAGIGVLKAVAAKQPPPIPREHR